MIILIKLIAAHYLCDFGLQSEFVALNKAPGQFYWVHMMTAHCAIHAGAVLLITNNPWLALGEFAYHFMIDCAKCEHWIGFNMDQALHIVCKFVCAYFCLTL